MVFVISIILFPLDVLLIIVFYKLKIIYLYSFIVVFFGLLFEYFFWGVEQNVYKKIIGVRKLCHQGA